MKFTDSSSYALTDIAIIGLSGRFPGASNYNEFWEHLLQEKETISFFLSKHSEPNFVNGKPHLEGSDQFDADFFKISAKEAILMDPQHRLLLQAAWHAFEDAGYNPYEIKGKVGVFATSNFNTYQHVDGWFSHYWKAQQKKPSSRFLAYTGAIQDSLSMRISYKLNLKGPSITVQTACSSSLVALHLACQSLLLGESDVTLIGASALTFPDREGYYAEPGMIFSPDGHCRAFDAAANGVIFGNGVACAILKPLERAIVDKDYVYGVIKGSAINNDGARKVDFNAPSVAGQEEVIQEAHTVANVDPETISYIEAHGTGTIVGDPIEFEALRNVFTKKTQKKNFCGLGSVKTNVGHLDAASGMAGLFKALLALDRQVIPATIHFSSPNPHLQLADSPFYIVDKKKAFKASSSIRRCAVTSLGIGGTNAHVILQEAPRIKKKSLKEEGGFFLLSAETEGQLHIYLNSLLGHIQKNRKQIVFHDLLYTLATSRIQKTVRSIGFFKNLEELEAALVQNQKKEKTPLQIYTSGEEKEIRKKIPSFISEAGKECFLSWVDGKSIADHPFFHSFETRRIPLPGYPFEEKRYWYDQIEELKSISKDQTIAAPAAVREGNSSFQSAFISWFAKVMGSQEDEIDLDASLERYNINSILAISLTEQLCQRFAPVSKTIFFEHYRLRDLFKAVEEAFSKKERASSFSEVASSLPPSKQDEQIAIVGIDCHFPFSKTPDELWENLLQGKNLVTEIPKNRWDHSLYFDEKPGIIGKTYSKWGGFLDEIDTFDPLFFKISPREAILLDPQERLFLQSAWKTLEDAGYTPEGLNRKTDHQVGVYVGASYQESQLYGIEERAKNNPVILNGVMATIANRVSYFCGFRGPSLVVDTMCSSSLTALSLACQDLHSGTIQSALVGGVNVIPHPNRYLQLAQERLLATDGLCKSYGPGGFGYVPTEGIGCVLLKPLSAALRDQDHIYGLVAGVATNHGGKTNGFTVPNARAQSELIHKTLEKSGMQPERISYVEGHGTGTTLGDSIEVLALTQAFNTKKKQFCALGSVKSNLGHAESAAGISGLIKVLLQLKYKLLVPSIHSEITNSSIAFEETPFYIQRSLQEWKSTLPRVAALSSFGAGGANAHAILEEYVSPVSERMPTSSPPYLIILSARSEERLNIYANSLLDFLQKKKESGLAEIAFTLAVGREAMAYRAGWICSSIEELITQLSLFCKGEQKKETVSGEIFEELSSVRRRDSPTAKGRQVSGRSRVDSPANSAVNDRDCDRATVQIDSILEGVAPKDLPLLKRAWLQGVSIDWSKFYQKETALKRISLPTYPFEAVDCRFKAAPKRNEQQLHPLVHENISDLEEVRFRSLLNEQIESISDHRIGERVIYPGAAYIEMVLFLSSSLLKLKHPVTLTQINWLKPLYLTCSDSALYLSVIRESGKIGIEIWKEEKGKEEIHFQASVFAQHSSQLTDLQKDEAIQRSYDHFYNRDECYRKFKEQDFQYGKLYQTIQSIQVRGKQALVEAEVDLSGFLFTLHPALLDAVFQSSIAFEFGSTSSLAYVPTGIESLSLYRPLSNRIFISITHLDEQDISYREYDIRVYNDQKELCLEIRKFRETPLLQKREKSFPSSSVVYIQKSWKESSLIPEMHKKIPRRILYASRGLKIDNAIPFDEEAISAQLISLWQSLQNRAEEERGEAVQVMILLKESDGWKGTPFVSFFKALALEHPAYFGKVVLVPEGGLPDSAIEKEWPSKDFLVRYDSSLKHRFVETYEEVSHFTKKKEIPLVRPNGVYLITGGSGGIGRLCVQFFIEKNIPCRLILTGRKAQNLKPWGNSQVTVQYHQCDMGDREAVLQLVRGILAEENKIDGIFHLAGVNHDSLFLKKTKAKFEEVLRPKIEGLLYLDQATQELSLDYFILFSSDSSIFGNAGQVDYSAANGFLDGFAHHREELREKGERKGVTKVFNWPYWKEGGMSLKPEVLDRIYEREGVVPLETRISFEAMDQVVSSSLTQVLVLQGNRQKILDRLAQPISLENGAVEEVMVDAELENRARAFLRNALAEELKIEPHLLQEETPFENFGIDSILSMNIISGLEKTFKQLPKTLFFEYLTFGALIKYFLAHHSASFKLGNSLATHPKVPSNIPSSISSMRNKKRAITSNLSTDVAIIGIAGKYPQADSLEELWENLLQGKNCIEEIPLDRFDYRTIFEENTRSIGKSRGKWGGFLKDVYGFDPLFFKISKDEAERLDPQEKLFLQIAWQALEDGGYTRDKLTRLAERKVGVYVGSMYQEYQIFNGEQAVLGNPVMLGGSASSIANRVSYFLNLIGPSLALDTMCSSAITAIAVACQDIVRGRCKMALAGGVNVSVHPNKYQILTYENFLSSNGLCKSFGAEGDGYVPSEGVGAVLLKSLDQAKIDRDPIYAVIKGIDINHGGQASGFTVPNATAQAEAIRYALEQSAIPAERISYIEAHGTGTALGDPIELSGLSQVFGSHDLKKKIPLGSIKSNIGHCESAAGMAALSKVLLQMQHNCLVPSIHSIPPNPYIPFETLPFSVQQEVAPWEEENKVALISSFGAGGSNASMVVEQHVAERASTVHSETKGAKLFVLSAQQPDRLHRYVENFLSFLDRQNEATFSLADCCYTLQTGREVFKERLAIVFDNFVDLKKKLSSFLENKIERDVFRSKQTSLNEMIEAVGIQEDFREFIEVKSQTYSIQVVGRLWVHGAKINWLSLYGKEIPSILHLPTYPFASIPCVFKKAPLRVFTKGEKRLHPLLHRNASTLTLPQMVSVFEESEPLLRDHIVHGEKLLPGAAIAEIFLSSGSLLSENAPCHLENLVWLRAVRMQGESLFIRTVLIQSDGISAELRDVTNEVLSQCKIVYDETLSKGESFSIDELKKGFPYKMQGGEIYSEFVKSGFSFGPTFKTLVEIAYSDRAFLAKVELQPEASLYSECKIQPYLLDAALQATIVLSLSDASSLPFSIRKVVRNEGTSEPVWIYGYRSNEKKREGSIYDLFLLDKGGQAIVSIYGFQDAPIARMAVQSSERSIDDLLNLVAQNSLNIQEAEEALILLST